MTLKITIEDKDEKARSILLLNLGILEALKEDLVSLYQAEIYLFSPYSVEKLKEAELDKNIIDLILEGCELEDILNLLPNNYNNKIDNLITRTKKLLNNYSKITDYDGKKWID